MTKREHLHGHKKRKNSNAKCVFLQGVTCNRDLGNSFSSVFIAENK